MNPPTARKGRTLPGIGFLAKGNLYKRREIRFSALPPGQAERAAGLLSGLQNLESSLVEGRRAVIVGYHLTDYTFEGLESALRDQGFHLENTLYAKFIRALVSYCEGTQLHNLQSPERLIKKSNEVYMQAYEHHPHGDHDDTPPELREYR